MQLMCYKLQLAIKTYPVRTTLEEVKLLQLLGMLLLQYMPFWNINSLIGLLQYIRGQYYLQQTFQLYHIFSYNFLNWLQQFQLPMQQENKKAVDNALFKKLQQIAIKMPSDPILYKEDVQKYKELFKIQFEKIQEQTMKKSQRFGELLIFLAKSVRFFPQQLGFIPTTTMSLMNQLGKSLHHYNRKKCISAIMILRAKNILYPISTIQFLLKQFNIQDKQLRKMLYKYISNDIRRMNKHHKNNQINQQLKKFISQYITKYSDKTAQKSLQLMIDMYKRNIWTDNRTVNIIAEGCFNASPKNRLIACHFLISTTEPLEEIEDSDSDNEVVNPSDIKWRKGVRRHTKNKQKQLEKQKRRAQRRLRKRQIVGRTQHFMPIDLIYSPQEFAEKLFNLMNQKTTKFSHKLFYMGLISRIIWRHKLIILPFYGALQKYMDPRQKQSPKVLAFFAQSVHDLVPQDQIQPIVKHIIQTFVNDKCSQFTMTIGLNTIRQIYSKFCSIITEQAMIYLCTYYQYKNKNVSTAAKSVINLVREINPYLLEKKFRGKNHNEPVDFMKQVVGTRIKGASLLGQDEGDMPIQMARILTDDDFKRIRKLMKKQEEEDGWGEMKGQQEQGKEELEINSDEFVQVQDDGQEADQQDIEVSSQEEDQDGEEEDEIEWDDAEQIGQEVQGQQQQDGEQIDEQQDEQAESGQEQLEWNSQDVLEEYQQQDSKKNPNNKTKPIKKADKTQPLTKGKNNHNIKKKSQRQRDMQSDSEEQQSSDQNPHGFIDLHRIAFYKQSKTQIKAERRRNPEAKEKFKHTPKQKKGGTSNEEKGKHKPIMMLRAKKNKLKLREKQVKIRIKSLKTQLGKVRSGKQATRLKNKVVKK